MSYASKKERSQLSVILMKLRKLNEREKITVLVLGKDSAKLSEHTFSADVIDEMIEYYLSAE